MSSSSSGVQRIWSVQIYPWCVYRSLGLFSWRKLMISMSISYRFTSLERRRFHCLSRFLTVFFSCRWFWDGWSLEFDVVVIQQLSGGRGTCENKNSSVRRSFWVSPVTINASDFFFFVWCVTFFSPKKNFRPRKSHVHGTIWGIYSLYTHVTSSIWWFCHNTLKEPTSLLPKVFTSQATILIDFY